MPMISQERWLEDALQILETTLADDERVAELGLERLVSSGGYFPLIKEIAERYLRPKLATEQLPEPETAVKDALRRFAAEKSSSPYPHSDDTSSDSSSDDSPDPESIIRILGILKEFVTRARRHQIITPTDANRYIRLLKRQAETFCDWNDELDERDGFLETLQEKLAEETENLERAHKELSDAAKTERQIFNRKEAELKQEASRLEKYAQTLHERESVLAHQQAEFVKSKRKAEAAQSKQAESLSQRESVVRCQEAKLAIDQSRCSDKDAELTKREADVTRREEVLRSRTTRNGRPQTTSPSPVLPANHWAVRSMGVDQDLRNLRARETKAYEREKEAERREAESRKREFGIKEKELEATQRLQEVEQQKLQFMERERDFERRLDKHRQANIELSRKDTELAQLSHSLKADSGDISRRWTELLTSENDLKALSDKITERQEELSRLEADAKLLKKSLDERQRAICRDEEALVRLIQEQDASFVRQRKDQDVEFDRRTEEQETLLRQREKEMIEALASQKSYQEVMLYEIGAKQQDLDGRQRIMAEREAHIEAREEKLKATLQGVPAVQIQMQTERISLETEKKRLEEIKRDLESGWVCLENSQAEAIRKQSLLELNEQRLGDWEAQLSLVQTDLVTREASVSAMEALLLRITSHSSPSTVPEAIEPPSRPGSNNPFRSITPKPRSATWSPNNPFSYSLQSPSLRPLAEDSEWIQEKSREGFINDSPEGEHQDPAESVPDESSVDTSDTTSATFSPTSASRELLELPATLANAASGRRCSGSIDASPRKYGAEPTSGRDSASDVAATLDVNVTMSFGLPDKSPLIFEKQDASRYKRRETFGLDLNEVLVRVEEGSFK
ncbi:hypothetical protein PQX77_010172 [Marasmius sp. AFHP31]|nr:hypothetical protein PQX77_010172 [Marasmius sp. AFHP31]